MAVTPQLHELNRTLNDTSETPLTQTSDIVCGPRCVRFILMCYGHREDLIDLIRELQWPQLESGSSVQSLSVALERRGIHTRSVIIGRNDVVRWNEPVLVHLTGSHDIGHFVVWLPGGNLRHVRIWDGLHGFRSLQPMEFAKVRSGSIVLTSRQPIEQREISVSYRNEQLMSVLGGGLVLVGLVTFLLTAFRNRVARIAAQDTRTTASYSKDMARP